jgi:hypothetical protein
MTDIDLRHLFPLVIPVVAIVMGIGIAMMALWIDFQKKSKLLELHHKERLLAIERGIDVPALPPEFFDNGRQRRRGGPRNDLVRGLWWLLVGLAFSAAMWVNHGPERAVWGLLPIAAGVAHLLSHLIGTSASARLPSAGELPPR